MGVQSWWESSDMEERPLVARHPNLPIVLCERWSPDRPVFQQQSLHLPKAGCSSGLMEVRQDGKDLGVLDGVFGTKHALLVCFDGDVHVWKAPAPEFKFQRRVGRRETSSKVAEPEALLKVQEWYVEVLLRTATELLQGCLDTPRGYPDKETVWSVRTFRTDQ